MAYDIQLAGKRLQRARKDKHYTQDYVSARANISEKFLSQIECGKAGLSIQTLLSLCEILDTSPNDILLVDSHAHTSSIDRLLKKLTPRQMQDAEDLLHIFVRNCTQKHIKNNEATQ